MAEYSAQCECGTILKVVLSASSSVQIYCHRCAKWIFTYPSSQTGATKSKKKPKIPEMIDQYHTVRQISEGSFGKVYLAFHSQTQEKVAIKVLQLDAFPEEDKENITDYFVREAQLLMNLNHPSIVQIKGAGNVSGNPYLSMEYIKGPTLAAILDRGSLSQHQALYIASRIASALEYAHQSFQLVHRDIKPANIILAEEKNHLPKLIDFGLAKTLGEHYHTLTNTGVMMGTPYYIPPEQILNSKGIDHRADIYSLGACLYYMITRIRPYYNHASTGLHRVLKAVLEHDLVPVREINPQIPKSIEKIIDKAMALAFTDRYSSFTEMKHDLKKSLAQCEKEDA